MKTITFNYTKKDGSTSERTLLVTAEPKPATDKYAGIDLSEISPEDASAFVLRYEDLYNEYLQNLDDLKEQFDLKYNYRQFFADNMTDVIEI